MKTITPAQWKLLEVFTWKLRVATTQQVLACDRALVGALNSLLKQRLLCEEPMLVRILVLERPLALWAPGDLAPDFPSLSWQMESRRHQTEPAICRVIWASERARHLSGGCAGPLRQPLQVEHDLGTAAMFFGRNQLDPETWDHWLGEDILRYSTGPRQNVPDAALCSSNGTIRLAIEFGGAYSADRLRRFHQQCLRRSIPYELW